MVSLVLETNLSVSAFSHFAIWPTECGIPEPDNNDDFVI